MTGSRKTRIRLAVFFLPFFPSGNGRRIAFFQADARFHGADSGDGQYQRFTLLAREQAVLANQGVQVIDQLIQPGFSDFHFMLIFLVWWRSVPALIHLDGDRQACIKTGLIPAGHLQGIALFYPAYAAGIRQLQAGGTVQTDHVGRFPQGVMTVTQLQLHRVTGSRLA